MGQMVLTSFVTGLSPPAFYFFFFALVSYTNSFQKIEWKSKYLIVLVMLFKTKNLRKDFTHPCDTAIIKDICKK